MTEEREKVESDRGPVRYLGRKRASWGHARNEGVLQYECAEQTDEAERLGYVCNPRSLKEGTETSRRRTDELGSRLERPIHFECKLNEPMHIGMLLRWFKARYTASNSRQLICQCSWGPVQTPDTASPLNVAPQPLAEASV